MAPQKYIYACGFRLEIIRNKHQASYVRMPKSRVKYAILNFV